uniref:hypothetical protein n=1 Tax=Enterocloster clostridioformis TaxID=1531 RepID=UPI0026EA9894|nr:hypothetical protein [Enterocloster clostridioformis]
MGDTAYNQFVNINNIIFFGVIIIVLLPLVICPDKITRRPACKIKNPTVLRVIGIIAIIVSIFMIVKDFL